MANFAQLESALNASHVHSQSEVSESTKWLFGFMLQQTSKVVAWVLLVTFAWALFTGGWTVFSVHSMLFVLPVISLTGVSLALAKIHTS